MGKRKMAIDITALTPTQVVLKLATTNQTALQKVSIQISSGFKNTDFEGFASDATTEAFLNFSSSLKDISTNISSNTSALARANAADSSIEQIQGYANDLAALITQRNNSASGSNVQLTLQAQGLLDNIASALNISFDSRFLFAGSKTNTKPVTNIQTNNIDYSGVSPVATASYYQGDSNIVSIRSSDAEQVDYGVIASDQSFQDLIGAAHLAIDGDTSNSTIKLGQAMDLVNKAINELASTRAVGKIAIDRMTKANATHQQTQLLIQGNLDSISQTDIVAATAKMSELQAIVQAGYLAFSRLSSLQLTNFLK